MGLYLSARSSIEILDEYNGEAGFFIKTFGLNTKRNKNGWRVSWDSIKKRIAGYAEKNLPGILYTKCTEAGCDLDHTDAATYESSLHVQEPFRVTDIVGHTLDEDNETGYLIHKLTQPHEGIDQESLDKFKQDIIEGIIQFVSPSVWPVSGQYDIIKGEHMPNGEPIINAYDWLPLHDAFVNDPAFGTDARVTATCEGEDCQVKLLTARQLSAYNQNHDDDGRFGYSENTDTESPDDEAHVRIPVRVGTMNDVAKWLDSKPINAKSLVAAPVFQTQTVIYRLAGNHEGPDDCDDFADQEFDVNDQDKPDLPIHENCECYYEDKQSGENLGQLNSRTLNAKTETVMVRHKGHLHFVSATKKMYDEIQEQIDKNGKLDIEQLPQIFKNNSFSACACSTLRMSPEEQLKAKLVAAEKETEDIKAKLTAAEKEKGDKIKELESKLAEMKGAIAACGKCGSTKHTSENHTDDNDGEGVDDGDAKNATAIKAVLTKLKFTESKLAKPMIATMVKAREIAGVSAEELTKLEQSLSAKSLEEVETIYNNESVFLKAATVEQQPEEGLHMPFNGATVSGALNGKTLEEIAGETA